MSPNHPNNYPNNYNKVIFFLLDNCCTEKLKLLLCRLGSCSQNKNSPSHLTVLIYITVYDTMVKLNYCPIGVIVTTSRSVMAPAPSATAVLTVSVTITVAMGMFSPQSLAPSPSLATSQSSLFLMKLVLMLMLALDF